MNIIPIILSVGVIALAIVSKNKYFVILGLAIAGLLLLAGLATPPDAPPLASAPAAAAAHGGSLALAPTPAATPILPTPPTPLASAPAPPPATLVAFKTLVGGILGWGIFKTLASLVVAGAVIWLLTKVSASKWLFMSLLAGAFWTSLYLGGGKNFSAAVVVIVAILGVFRFFYSRTWSETTSYDENDRPLTIKKSNTKGGFNGEQDT